MDAQIAQMLEDGDFLGLTELFACIYAENAPEAQMQYTDQIFTAIAEIRKANI